MAIEKDLLCQINTMRCILPPHIYQALRVLRCYNGGGGGVLYCIFLMFRGHNRFGSCLEQGYFVQQRGYYSDMDTCISKSTGNCRCTRMDKVITVVKLSTICYIISYQFLSIILSITNFVTCAMLLICQS